MKKLMFVVLACLFGVCGLSFGEGIDWWCGTGYAYYNGGTTLLNGDNSSSLGCFAQLLWVGPNGIIDPANTSGNGTGSGDDAVVSWWYMGAGAGGADGWFAGANVTDSGSNLQSNGLYFARFWTAPSPNYASGLVPTSTTNWYANSPTWTYPKVNPIADTFDVTSAGNISTTLKAIPEPAALGLALIGLVALRFTIRKKS